MVIALDEFCGTRLKIMAIGKSAVILYSNTNATSNSTWSREVIRLNNIAMCFILFPSSRFGDWIVKPFSCGIIVI